MSSIVSARTRYSSIANGLLSYRQPSTGATALLTGLSARMMTNQFYHHVPITNSGLLLLGLWEGLVFYHILQQSTTLASGIFLGYFARLVVDFFTAQSTGKDVDSARIGTTLIAVGVALGVSFCDVLVQVWNDQSRKGGPFWRSRKSSGSRRRSGRIPSREWKPPRSPQSVFGGGHSRRLSGSTAPGIILPSEPMDVVSKLWLEASEAACQNARLKQEHLWAVAQGNEARASQLEWEIKRSQRQWQRISTEAGLKAYEASLANGAASTLLIDGVTAEESVEQAEGAIENAQNRGHTHVKIVFGKTAAKAKSQVLVRLRERRVWAMEDPQNREALIASLRAPSSAASTVPISDDWSRALD